MPHDCLDIPTVLSFSAYTLLIRAFSLLGQSLCICSYLVELSLAFADRSA